MQIVDRYNALRPHILTLLIATIRTNDVARGLEQTIADTLRAINLDEGHCGNLSVFAFYELVDSFGVDEVDYVRHCVVPLTFVGFYLQRVR
jgi:hypothetical protein